MNMALIQPWNTYLPDLVKSSSEVLIFSAEYIIGHPRHDREGKRFCRLVCHEQNMSKIYIAMDVVKSFAVTNSPVCPAQRVQTMGWVLGEKLQKERTMLYIVPYWHLLL
jgi:hypothetical protein